MKIKRSAKQAAGLILIGFLLILSVGIFQFRHAIACELLPIRNYQKVNNQVFVGHDIIKGHHENLLQKVNLAWLRINNVYGKTNSNPRIFITSNPATALKWGANETASMHRLPWRSCIVVGPKGQNVDVLSHELLHAEIQHRVGFWTFLKEIPVWFDEGAALTVDYREPFLPENINLPENKVNSAKNLKKAKDFFTGNIRENYQLARMAIIPMIEAKHFFNNLDKISQGETFTDVFATTNKSIQQPSEVTSD